MPRPPFPIHHALNKGSYYHVRLYVENGGNTNEKDGSGFTPLIICSMIEDEEWSCGMARLLLEHGARISICDRHGYNALHHACVRQRAPLVEIFLQALDCNIHSKSSDGNTSLHVAALHGNKEIVHLIAKLLSRFKLTMDPKNRQGMTPLQQAWKTNHIDCGDLLVNLGANDQIPHPQKKDKRTSDLRDEAIDRLLAIEKLTLKNAPTREIRPYCRKAEFNSTANLNTLNDTSTLKRPKTTHHMFRGMAAEPKSNHEKSKVKSAKDKQTQSGWRDEIISLWQHYEARFARSFRKPATHEEIQPSKRRRRKGVISRPSSTYSSRRNSRPIISKSSSGSVISVDGYSYANKPQEISSARRPSLKPQRSSGMPPVVRAQSRTSFNIPDVQHNRC